MPTLVVAAVAAIGGFIQGVGGALLIMYATEIATGVLLLGSMALTQAQARRAKRKARDAYNAAQQDRLVNIAASTAPRELVLGRLRKGGTVIFRGSAGAKKETFLMVIAVAGHEIEGVDAIYFNDEEVELSPEGYVTSEPYTTSSKRSGVAIAGPGGVVVLPHTPVEDSVTATMSTGEGENRETVNYPVTVDGNTVTTEPNAVIQYQYVDASSKARVWWHLGTAGQAADARIIELFPDQWTAAHRLAGVAYLVCEFTYDETAFPSGLPAVTAVVRGAKVYDPRTGLTAWSENPALHVRHVYTHPMFGKATVSAEEDARIIAAANACDIVHEYVVDEVTIPRVMFKAATVVQFGAPAREALDDLTQAMGGMWAFAGGEFYVRAGVYTAPVITLTDDDLAVVGRTGDSVEQSPITISPHRERAQQFNVVNARIWDEAQAYKETALAPLKGAALITRDGQELAQEVSIPAVTFSGQALHVAGIMMRDARDPLTVVLPFKMRAYPIELFDNVELALQRYGWESKEFMVMGREYGPNGTVQLTLKETDPAIFDPDAEFKPGGHADNTSLRPPWEVAALEIDAVTSGDGDLVVQSDGTVLTRVRVLWDAIEDEAVTQNGQVEIQYRLADVEDAWESARVPGSETQALLTGLVERNHYIFRIRARTSLAVGVWSLQVMHLVLGKAAPPPQFDEFEASNSGTGLRVFEFAYTTTPAPLDLAGAQIRFLAGLHTSPAWESMGSLAKGLITASPFETSQLGAGDWTLACCAVDTSGNFALPPLYAQATFGVPDASPGTVYLSSPAVAFVTRRDGSVDPASITLTAYASSSFVSPTFAWYTVTGGVDTLIPGEILNTLIVPQIVGPGSVTYKVVVTEGAEEAFDLKTIVGIEEGSDALWAYLENEAHQVACASDGTILPGQLALAMTLMLYLKGTTVLYAVDGVTYSIVDQVGGTATVDTDGIASMVTMSADTALITIRGEWDGNVRDRVFKVTKVRQGVPGDAAKGLTLSATSQVFRYAKATPTTASPSSITLTAAGQNLAGSPSFSVSTGSATLTGTGSARTFTAASASDSLVVQVSWDGLTDTMSFTKLREGLDGDDGQAGIAALLTNESHTLPASSTGVVSSWTGASGVFRMYEGIDDITTAGGALGSVSYSLLTNPDVVSVSINATTGAYSATGAGSWANASRVTNITLRATYGGQTFDRILTLTKALIGANGATGSTGADGAAGDSQRVAYIVNTSASPPSTPAATSGSSSVPSGYSATPTASLSSGQFMYRTDGTYNAATNLITWRAPYLANLKVGALSALTADLGTVTAGQITSSSFILRTGTTGARMAFNEVGNSLRGYDASNNLRFQLDADLGYIAVRGVTTSTYVINGIATAANGNAVLGHVQAGNGLGVHGIGISGNGVRGESTSSSGVYGKSSSAPGVLGESASGYAGHFLGNSSRGPVRLEPSSALPSFVEPGGLCYYAGDFYGANGSSWRKLAFV